jgi:hypothetical protein
MAFAELNLCDSTYIAAGGVAVETIGKTIGLACPGILPRRKDYLSSFCSICIEWIILWHPKSFG